MSQWTHVVGSIRFDNLLGLTPEPDLGITCTFEGDQEEWDRCNIPCGSEGSLIISKWRNHSDSSLARWTVTIFGDLRDYEDEEEIIEYFNRIIKGQIIRQGCFTFEVEGNNPRTFIYTDVTKNFKEI